MHTEKHDRTVSHGGRHFAIRLYDDGAAFAVPRWNTIIVEDELPLRHDLAPGADVDRCLDAAVAFVAALVDTPSTRPPA